jgi:hypothetical protein
MIFKGNSNIPNLGFFKRTAQEVIAANATSPKNPLKFFSLPTGNIKTLTFKNTMGKLVMVCGVNKLDREERRPTAVGAVITNNSITLSNFTPSALIPSHAYDTSTFQTWLLPGGTKFKLQGTANNDSNVFAANTVVTTGSNTVITLDTTNGAAGVAETIPSTAPVLCIPFEVVPLFEILDGDSITWDMKANLIETGVSVDFYIYSDGSPSTSNINGIRAYSFG